MKWGYPNSWSFSLETQSFNHHFLTKKTDSSWDTSEVERVGETERNLHCSLTEIVISLIIICMMYNVCLCCVYN